MIGRDLMQAARADLPTALQEGSFTDAYHDAGIDPEALAELCTGIVKPWIVTQPEGEQLWAHGPSLCATMALGFTLGVMAARREAAQSPEA